MNIKEKLEQILLETEQRIKEKPNILGMADHPMAYHYLVAKIEAMIDFMEYEDQLLEKLSK